MNAHASRVTPLPFSFTPLPIAVELHHFGGTTDARRRVFVDDGALLGPCRRTGSEHVHHVHKLPALLFGRLTHTNRRAPSRHHAGRSGDERCHTFVDDNALLYLLGELGQRARSARWHVTVLVDSLTRWYGFAPRWPHHGREKACVRR